MSKFCGECGFALDKEYNFCPNCGSKIESNFESGKNVEKDINRKVEIIVCSNCGEENPAGLTACESCGAALSGNSNIEIKKVEVKNTSVDEKKTKNKKPVDQRNDKKQKEIKVANNQKSNVKELNSKFIFGIAGGILAIVVFVLFISGVFDKASTLTNTVNQQTNSGVNLNNLNEIADLEKIVAANPSDMNSLIKLANLQNDSGLHEKAIENYKKYLDKNPSDADARIDLGVCYYNTSNFSKAISEMETALKYAPKHQIAHLNLGIVNLSAGNLQAAKEWFQKTVDIDPNSDAGKRAQELLKSH